MNKKQNDIIKKIPDYLTASRIIIAPIIILLGIFGFYKFIVFLVILSIISNILDGYLAKKWLVETNRGIKFDLLINKFFYISILFSLAFKIKLLFIPLILEIIIGLSNIYYFNKTNKTDILEIGKIKSIVLSILILMSFIYLFSNFSIRLENGIIYMVINIQLLSIISYYFNYENIIYEQEELENKNKLAKTMDKLENKTIMLDKIEDLLNDYEKKDIL